VQSAYPQSAAQRSRWVTALRGRRNPLDPWRPYAYLWEEETGADGAPVPTATLFLTNRECPYRCLMCDLWQNTLEETVPAGAIPTQIAFALAQMPAAKQIKLYNAGSFFDPKAIPPQDYPAIAQQVAGFERVIVECHPSLLGERCLRFQAMLAGRLEVAVGLETANPVVLNRLNKRITVDDFRRAASFLSEHGIDLRVFVLLRPPFQTEREGLEWACCSLDVAFDCGARVCCIIPTRGGNGAMEALARRGEYAPPSLRSLERTVEYGLTQRRGLVFADLWDVERFFRCDCSPERARRLAQINRTQQVAPPVCCTLCEEREDDC
jgi:radical SAM enzyme (TIGR01210 family)